MINDIIILAGGFGERLWPASSASWPKQFLSFSGGLSFLQESIMRAVSVKPNGKIVIVTRKDLAKECAHQCKILSEKFAENERKDFIEKICVLAEPYTRHTAAAIMLSSYFSQLVSNSSTTSKGCDSDVSSRDISDRTILILTSDHVISPTEKFVEDCQKAAAAAEKGYFVCFAITPKEPSSAYGYIKSGKTLDDIIDEIGASGKNSIFAIDNFKEKPDEKTAQKYLAEGNYWWNSGMFVFTSKALEKGMKKLTPEIYDAFEPIRKSCPPSPTQINGIDVYENWETLEKAYQTVPQMHIDKAIAEKTKHAAVVRATFDWIDVGNWDVFSNISENSAPQFSEVNSTNNFIYSDIPVVTCGIEDLVIVIKNGSALIMKKGCSSLVKEAVQKMK